MLISHIAEAVPVSTPREFMCTPTTARQWEQRKKQKALLEQMEVFCQSFVPKKPSRLQYGLNWIFGFYDSEITQYTVSLWQKDQILRCLESVTLSDYYQALQCEDLAAPQVIFHEKALCEAQATVRTTHARLTELSPVNPKLEHDNEQMIQMLETSIRSLNNGISASSSFDLSSDTNNEFICEGYNLRLRR